jgi:hypothetical protein
LYFIDACSSLFPFWPGKITSNAYTQTSTLKHELSKTGKHTKTKKHLCAACFAHSHFYIYSVLLFLSRETKNSTLNNTHTCTCIHKNTIYSALVQRVVLLVAPLPLSFGSS